MKICNILAIILTIAVSGCASSVRVKHIAMLKPIITKSEESKPVMFKKVIVKVPRGRVVGSVQGGLMCVPQAEFYWRGGRVNIPTDDLGEVLRDELEKNGYTVVGDPNALFEDEDSWKAEYLIGARVSEIAANICYPWSGYGNFSKAKGEGYLEVEWHIYSRRVRDVVLKFKTEGSSKIKKAMRMGDEEVFYQAFAMAVNNMLADREFFELVALDKEVEKRIEKVEFEPIKIKYKKMNDAGIKKEFNKSNMVANIRKATVTVYAGGGHGSGFLISDDGYILTNSHVVGGANFVQVKLVTGSERTGEVIRRHKERDVALIKLEEDLYPYAVFGTSANVSIKDEVFAIGAPLKDELANTVSKGIVSSFRVKDDIRYIQSDVTIQPGNSGGPLVNEKYGVVGIAVQGEMIFGITPGGLGRRTVGLNYFIPIEEAIETLNIEQDES